MMTLIFNGTSPARCVEGKAPLRCYRGRHLLVSILCCAILTGLAAASHADANLDATSRALTITLRGGGYDKTFAAMLAALTEHELIQLFPYSDPAATTPGELLAKAAGLTSVKQLPGGGITKPIEQYLCDINSHVCTRKHRWRFVSRPTSEEPGGHCPDDDLARNQICAPAMQIKKGLTLLLVPYNSRIDGDRSLSEIVRQLGSCDSLDSDCKQKIKALNSSEFTVFGRKTYASGSDKLLVPSTSYQVALQGTTELDDEEWIAAIHEAYGDAIKTLEKDPAIKDPRDKVLLRVGPGYTSAGSPLSDPRDNENLPALESMHYPKPAPTNVTGSIVFLFEGDSQPELAHCDFATTPANQNGGPCASEQFVPKTHLSEMNHATQVAGILASKANNFGITGIDPSVEPRLFTMTAESQDFFGDNILALAGTQNFAAPYVLNFSWRLDSGHEDFVNSLRLTGGTSFLVVAAAGNDGKEIKPVDAIACDVFPACLTVTADQAGSLQNVLSVVALDVHGQKLLPDADCHTAASNFGKAFDVAAVGIFVSAASSTSGEKNGLAPFCGTSAAAPIVSGLASLVIVAARDIGLQPTPIAVRDRIAATSDIDVHSLKNVIRFGRVNFERALTNLDKDRILGRCEAKQDGCWEEEKLPAKHDIEIQMKRGNETLTVPLSAIRRLRRVDRFANGDAIAFDAVFRADGVLVRDRVTIPKGIPLGRDPDRYPVESIFEFVSCSFTVDCEGPPS